MCFHFNLNRSAEKVSKHFNAAIKQPNLFESNYNFNGFTFPKTPVLLDEETQLIQSANWGLIPFWAKDRNIQKYTLNTKIETLTEKPSFRTSVNKRCLVIADSFYEWQWLDPKGKNKQEYEISKTEDKLFGFGGIWSEWTDRETGEIVKSYTIVTTAANELMAKIHNTKKRMPLVLNQAEEASWLKGADIELFKKREVDLKATEVY
jgi:putative SOS response-associated peptidase YedK